MIVWCSPAGGPGRSRRWPGQGCDGSDWIVGINLKFTAMRPLPGSEKLTGTTICTLLAFAMRTDRVAAVYRVAKANI